jgi:hypothetical protein
MLYIWWHGWEEGGGVGNVVNEHENVSSEYELENWNLEDTEAETGDGTGEWSEPDEAE